MQGADDDRVTYFVPLWPFEKRLVQELAHVLDQSESAPLAPVKESETQVTEAFEKWHWSRLVRDCLLDDLGEEQVTKEYQNDKAKAYDSFLHFLAHQGEAEQSLFRANQLRDSNEDFLEQLSNKPITCVDVRPIVGDAAYWETISRVYHTLGHPLIFKDSLFASKGDFEIWKLIRKFVLRWLSPGDGDTIQQALFCNSSFQMLYEVTPREAIEGSEDAADLKLDGEGYKHVVLRKRDQDGEGSMVSPAHTSSVGDACQRIIQWSEEEPKIDADGKISDAYMASNIIIGRLYFQRVSDLRSRHS
jgi:hypothetical protein